MAASDPMSLFALQSLIKERLEASVRGNWWVTAEISELKRHPSGHCYLELTENDPRSHLPKAQARAVIWRSAYQAIAMHFLGTTGSDLAAGMKVLVKASVSYHELYGLSLVISDIDPAYTLGEMEMERRRTILQLQQEGIFDMNRELPLPDVIQRVALVSSPTAAGYQDFVRETESSPYRIQLTLFEATVQGHGAEQSLTHALGRIAALEELFDAVVIIRGGGSKSDLSCFDSYLLCSHIAQFPLPVLTGIGHDKDQSVADLVAALSLKTPTAVAAHLVALAADFEARLYDLQLALDQRLREIVPEMRSTIQNLALRLNLSATRAASAAKTLLERQTSALSTLSAVGFSRAALEIDHLSNRLRTSTADRLTREREKLSASAALVSNLDPKHILDLGFSIVRKEGKAVRDTKTLHPGDPITITLSKGTTNAIIE